MFKKYADFLRRPPAPPHKDKGFEAATAELAKLVHNFGWDLGPAVNKVAHEYGANARALYTFAALGPMEAV